LNTNETDTTTWRRDVLVLAIMLVVFLGVLVTMVVFFNYTIRMKGY